MRWHLMSAHREVFVQCIGEAAFQRQELLDYYEEALKHKCRECMPITSLSQDRRTGEYLSAAYNEESINCYMCFVCGEEHLHLAGFDRFGDASHYKGSIEYVTIGQLMQRIGDNHHKWDENFDYDLWKERYAPKLQSAHSNACGKEHGFSDASWEWKRSIAVVPYKGGVHTKQALCCPEDVRSHPSRCDHEKHTLCKHCSVPMCLEC